MFERLTKHAGKLEDRNMNVELGGGTLGLEDFVDDFYELDGTFGHSCAAEQLKLWK